MLKEFGLAAVLATGIVAVAAPAAAQEQKQVTIGVSIPAATHGWTGGVNFHAKRTADLLQKRYPGLKVVITSSGSASQQANALEDMASVQKVNALVILPFESDPLTEPVRQVKQSGAFITVVDRGLKDPAIQDVYVAGNNPELGRVSAEYMKQALGGKGQIVVLRGIPTVIDDERVKAFEEAMKGSEIKILDKQYANWNRDDGFKVMQDYLARFPKIDAVWAQDDDIALGVLEAVKQAGRENEMFVVGGAGMKDIVKRVMDGDRLTPVDVLYPPAMISTAMEITALHFYGAAPVRGSYLIGSPLITKENAKEYYFPDSPF
ncbi:MAG TPA: ABC transporter substrate-binding protein [Alphaproteobacteria bacterium]|nr:ABC transporter substrate-binding protein [Alphaproteobacteria bacterium]